MDDRLTHIGVGVTGQAAEPCVDGVDRFVHRNETPPIDDPLHLTDHLVSGGRISIHDRDRCRHIAIADMILSERLKRRIGVCRLIVRIRIDECRSFIRHDLFDDGRKRFSFGEPLTPVSAENLCRLRFVHRQETGHPAIRKSQTIQIVEKARLGCVRKALQGEDAQMVAAEHRFQAANKIDASQNRIEIGGRFRSANRMAFGR